MTVHFIGAGPGAPDLITVRGRDLIARCPVCLYAGSLVPRALLDHCPPGARIVDTAPMSLDEIVAEVPRARLPARDVAACIRAISRCGARWASSFAASRPGHRLHVTPGVPSFAAAAAALGQELTLPEVAQTVVLTRTVRPRLGDAGRREARGLRATGATLAIHLSIHVLDKVVAELLPFYGADCPAAVVYRASWPDERVIRGTLGTIAAESPSSRSSARR
jgi:precorrin-4/cobalt-precorrin-4 C11-methyltransferase